MDRLPFPVFVHVEKRTDRFLVLLFWEFASVSFLGALRLFLSCVQEYLVQGKVPPVVLLLVALNVANALDAPIRPIDCR